MRKEKRLASLRSKDFVLRGCHARKVVARVLEVSIRLFG